MKKNLTGSLKAIVLLMLIITFTANKANAQAKDNSATWESMKYGMFVHYVFGGEYGGMTPLSPKGGFPKDIDEFVNKFDVQKFANDVQAMGFEYVIFTAWHANMGVLYPSKVMADYGFDQKDHFSSKRDLLGEIMDSLAVRGIQFSIYTHIFVGHDFHPQGSGYFMYDNKTGKITQDMINSGYVDAVNGSSTKWNDFINKVYDEMSSRYGDKVCAYWFDGSWVPSTWVDKNRMMATIRKTNPTAAMVANGTPDHGLPYCSKEVGSPGGNDYGFNSDFPPVYNNDVRTWPTYQRSIALIQGGNWWASTGGQPKFDAKSIYKYTVLEAGTNSNGGVSWAFAPFVNGEWESNILDINKQVSAYLTPVAESVKKTKPSTSFITKEGSKMNNLSNGYVATKSLNGLYEYIHVLNTRTDRFLRLPNTTDGRVFDSVELLAKHKSLQLIKNDKGYLILLPDGENWDALNTVFRLRLSEFIYTAKSTSASFVNPWEGKKLSIKDASGTQISYTNNGNECSFVAKTGAKYVISEIKAPEFKSGKVDTNPKAIQLSFSNEIIPHDTIKGFTIKVNQVEEPVKSISKSTDNQSIVLNMDKEITKDDEISLSYSNGTVISVDGYKLVDFNNKIIDNLLPGASPLLVSAETNTDGTEIVLHFNQNMQLPSLPSPFVIANTNKQLTINSISLKTEDNSSMIIKPSEKIFLEDLLKLSYDHTSIKSEGNGILKPIDSFLIFNNSPGMPPSIKSGKLINNGLGIELEFTKTLMGIVQQQKLFSVKINGTTATLASLSGESNKIIFNLKYPVRYGDKLALNFSGGEIKATDGGSLSEINNYEIANNLTSPTYSILPGKLEAEKSAQSYGIQVEGTSDTGGGQNVGYIDAGDWLEFAVDVAEDGNYTVEYRVSGQGAGKIVLQTPGVNDAKTIATTTFAATGGWQTWTSVKASVVLKKGKQIMRIFFANGQTNINWISFVKDPNTGIKTTNETGFEIFPNPASKELRIESGSLLFDKIEIFDLTGRIIISKKVKKQQKCQIDLNLDNGIYCLKVGNEIQSAIKRFVVQN
jgi:uncharacterized repeat protein (TIGR02059 family)